MTTEAERQELLDATTRAEGKDTTRHALVLIERLGNALYPFCQYRADIADRLIGVYPSRYLVDFNRDPDCQECKSEIDNMRA